MLLVALSLLLIAAAVVLLARRRNVAPTPTPAVVVLPPKPKAPPVDLTKPVLEYEEDKEVDPTKLSKDAGPVSLGDSTLARIFFDEDAIVDEPTNKAPVLRIDATARTHGGLRRKRNEDRVLSREDDELFVVADGMGGQVGGATASDLAIEAISNAFETRTFPGSEHSTLPRRAAELARAIQLANASILDRARSEKLLAGMGTTLCAVRFSTRKQRFYVGHVGDSRLYRLRDGRLRQLTSDHTMRAHGLAGDGADDLTRALGLDPRVKVDVLLGKPKPGDIYLLCSDGLTKMVSDDRIRDVLASQPSPDAASEELIRLANDGGGKDNISVVVMRVEAADTERLSA